MPRALVVEILGSASQFAAELDKAAGKTRQFGKAAGVAGLAIAGGLAVGLDKSVKAAADAEVQTARMNDAFKQTGQSATKYAGQIDQAEAAGRNLGFMNSDLRNSLGSLEIATHDPTKAFKDLGVAEDIARFKHIGLGDATKMVTMAMAGSQRATKALGLSITPVTSTYDKLRATMHGTLTEQDKLTLAHAKGIDKQKTAAEVIGVLTDKLHGQKEAYASTTQGGVDKMHAQLNALAENLGKALLPKLGELAQKLADATGWLAKHSTVAKILVGVLAGVAGAMMAVSVATTLANAAFLVSPIGLIVEGLVALGIGLVVAYKKSATFREIVQAAFAAVKIAFDDLVQAGKAFVTALENIWNRIKGFVVPVLRGAFDSAKALVVGAFNVIRDLFTTFGDVIHGRWGKVWSDLKQTVVDAFNAVKGYLGGLPKALAGLALKIGEAIFNGIINGLGDIGSAIANKIQSGLHIPSIHVPHIHIPGFAAGGIVTSPTLALVGERGPEAIVPLNRGGVGGRGGITLNVNLSGPVYGDKQAVARELAGAIRNELVSMGRREPNIFAGFA